MFLRKYTMILTTLIINLTLMTTAFGLIDNWYHYEQGMRQIAAKNYKQAQKEFNYYIEHPEMHSHMFGVAYFGRGLMFETLGNDGQAITEYRMAIKNDLHPTVEISYKAYINIGTIYMRNKVYQDAINAYSKAVKSSPKNGLAHYYLGLAYLRAGEYEKAEQESEEAKRLGITFTALSDKLSKMKNNPSKSGKANKTN